MNVTSAPRRGEATMGEETDTDDLDNTRSSRPNTVPRVVVTIGIVILAFAALWFVVNLLYALL